MRINLTSVFVDDQDAALAFYTCVLGFVKKTAIDLGEFKWLTVVSAEEPEGTELLLEPSANPAALTYKRALYEQGTPAASFAVDNMQAEFARLQAAGVRFAQPPQDVDTAWIAVLDDTGGNLIQLVQAK